MGRINWTETSVALWEQENRHDQKVNKLERELQERDKLWQEAYQIASEPNQLKLKEMALDLGYRVNAVGLLEKARNEEVARKLSLPVNY